MLRLRMLCVHKGRCRELLLVKLLVLLAIASERLDWLLLDMMVLKVIEVYFRAGLGAVEMLSSGI